MSVQPPEPPEHLLPEAEPDIGEALAEEFGAEVAAGTSEVLRALGPGLITGAADDDPSGIATYSQAGAQFGYGMLWTSFAALPLMIAVQAVCARIGLVTGQGLAANIRKVFPAPVLYGLVLLLLVANTINIAADIAAMGESAEMLIPGVDRRVFAAGFGLLSLGLQVWMPYQRYVNVLKWLTMALLAYVAAAFAVKIPWASLPLLIVTPHFALNRDSLTLIVAVFGTTISPYLFFWQSNEEVEELQASSDSKSLLAEPGRALVMMRRVGLDTVVGMAFSEAIAFFVILTAGATLNQHGVTNIATAAQAAQALRPIAGDFAYLVFSLGIIGTGLLAIPVLAGSAAYAAAETRGWREGLSRKLNEAPEFYAVIAASILGGMALSFSSLDPIQALFWAAVINGVVAVPIMVAALMIATNKKVMGQFTANRFERLFGWLGVAVMGLAALVMLTMMMRG